jgi:hypothetical protein
MPLNEDLKAAIDKNLNAEIGTALKERLSQAERDALTVKDLKAKLDLWEDDNKNLKKELGKFTTLEEQTVKAEAATKTLREATTDKKIVELIEKHSTEKVALMSQLVSLVFQNHQYKYTLNESGFLPTPQGGSSYNKTATGVGEGNPPPNPTK